ncbi:hypothetical protein KPL71_013740 [Citrus sinensis]|uniref:Uncharacterized protein n=1 Tax=Citrus sinensis TaxID=2711 RepID=A0ACB8K7L3_CITSI|nr:hypothetical protein KPL71_013740 [Citrus sinensis]
MSWPPPPPHTSHTLVSASRQGIIHYVTGFQWRQLPFTYLGSQSSHGASRFSTLMTWFERSGIESPAGLTVCFLLGGKLILIRHVISSMPLHLFHVFRSPATVVQRLKQLLTQFLWGDSEERRRIHWCRWPKACFPVDEGGLGLWSFDDMAEAFHIKLW